MYADLPGVTPQRKQWARCMAKQTVDYILGDNPINWSYVVGFGCVPDRKSAVALKSALKRGCVVVICMHYLPHFLSCAGCNSAHKMVH